MYYTLLEFPESGASDETLITKNERELSEIEVKKVENSKEGHASQVHMLTKVLLKVSIVPGSNLNRFSRSKLCWEAKTQGYSCERYWREI